MYFHDRVEAGRMLSERLVEKYRYEDTAVLALSAGGVVVGHEIASALHARLSLLMTEPIMLPGVNSKDALGAIDHAGHFTYNNMLPTGLVAEILGEMRNYVEEEKLRKLHKISQVMSAEGLIDPQMFYGHHVIIVSDGFKNGTAFEAAANYLKPLNTGKLIAVAPIVSVKASDLLHVMADEVYVGDTLSNYLDTNHYFEDNDIPDIEVLMDRIIHNWQ